MRVNPSAARWLSIVRTGLWPAWWMMALVLIAAAGPRVRLAPKFLPGHTLRYRIEARTTTNASTTTPIVNPEGASQATETIALVVRLDVLSAQPAAGGSEGPVRFLATYEQSSAKFESDAVDPSQPSLEDRYRRLEGRSLEFTVEPGGRLSDFQGLDELLADRSAYQAAISWLPGLLSIGRFPREGAMLGRTWKSERPLDGVPLAGLTWRAQSTYLRDEPCHPAGADVPAGAAPGPADSCAVILTRLQIVRSGSADAATTPEDYLRNGLRSSGSWTGSGESLDSLSLASGLLVSSTETSTQEMDYVIASAATGSSIHRRGRVQTQSEITLLSDARATAPR